MNGHPGDEPVLEPGPGSPELGRQIERPKRGWINLTGNLADPQLNQPLMILHHLMGRTLHLAMSNRGIIVVEKSGPFIHYRANTEPGSAGGPCFDANMNLVAMHQGTEGRRSFGTSARAIVQSMNRSGSIELVGLNLA